MTSPRAEAEALRAKLLAAAELLRDVPVASIATQPPFDVMLAYAELVGRKVYPSENVIEIGGRPARVFIVDQEYLPSGVCIGMCQSLPVVVEEDAHVR
jgi:hypothetical protein